jgi:hypothetical protein
LPTPNRTFTLELVAPIRAILDLHPGTLAAEVRLMQALGDKTFDLMLADGLPEGGSVIERFGDPPLRTCEP